MTELLLQPGQLSTASLLSLLIPKSKGRIPEYHSSIPKLSVSCSPLPHVADTAVLSMTATPQTSILSFFLPHRLSLALKEPMQSFRRITGLMKWLFVWERILGFQKGSLRKSPLWIRCYSSSQNRIKTRRYLGCNQGNQFINA